MRGTEPINSTWVYPNSVKLRVAYKYVLAKPAYFYFSLLFVLYILCPKAIEYDV